MLYSGFVSAFRGCGECEGGWAHTLEDVQGFLLHEAALLPADTCIVCARVPFIARYYSHLLNSIIVQ